jgi:microcystin-dependent protein
MPLSKFGGATNNIQTLLNKPIETPTELKKLFDKTGEELKEYINNILTTELDSKIAELTAKINSVYPVGAIYMSVNNTNPAVLFGGTWATWGTGRVPVGIDTNNTAFNTVEKIGGEVSHTLNISEMPTHKHNVNVAGSGQLTTSTKNLIAKMHYKNIGNIDSGSVNILPSSSAGSTINSVIDIEQHSHTIPSHIHEVSEVERGSGNAHNNLQPYITCYMWKRTA